MVFLLALTSAALYGTGDFLGGLASKRLHTAAVVAISQAAGLLVLLAVVAALPPADPYPRDILWGVAAGVAGAVGVAFLYRALAIGVMGVVAPLTAVCAVAIPVAVSTLRGVRPGPMVAAGMALALVAIVLISQQGATSIDGERQSVAALAPGVRLAAVSGVAIGLFFLALAEARAESGLWPLVGARAVAVPLCLAAAAFGRVTWRDVSLAPARTAALAGVVDMSANVLYLLASRLGSLPVAVTLSSLYPASTVLLARLVLGERLRLVQLVGMACALVAVACIVLGGSR